MTALIGAYISESQYSGSLTHAQAIAAWQANSGRTMAAERLYEGPGQNPATIPTNVAANVAAGRISVLSCKPLYTAAHGTPLKTTTSQATLDTQFNTFLSGLVTGGCTATNLIMPIWHEPYFSGITGSGGAATVADFIAMFQHYAPLVHAKGLKTAFITSASTVISNNENSYYPGDAYVDYVFTDYYYPVYAGGHLIGGGGATTDPAYPADHATPPKPFGIGEFNNSTDPTQGATKAQAQAYWGYLTSYFDGRLDAAQPCAPVMMFNSDSGSPNPRDSCVAVADGVIDPYGGGTAVEYRNTLIASLADTLAGQAGSFVQQVGSKVGTGATVAVTVGTGATGFSGTTTAGNRLVIGVTVEAGGTVASVADSKGNTWAIDKQGPGGAGITSCLASAPCTTPLVTGDTVTITPAASSTLHAGVIELAGVAGPDQTATAHTASSSVTAATAVNSGISGFVVAVAGTGLAATISFTAADPDSGNSWTDLAWPFSTVAGGCDLATQLGKASPSLYSATASASGTADMCVVSYKNAAGLAPPILAPTSLPAGEVALPYSQTITASGGTGPYTFALASGTLPTGLALTSGGVLSGTPTTAGTYNFVVQCTDAVSDVGTQAYQIPVTQLTVSTTSPLPNASQNAPYNQTMTAAGGPTPYTWAVTAGALPAGVTLASSGALTGTPTVSGPFTFTAQVTDANSVTATAALSLLVNAAAPLQLLASVTPAAGVDQYGNTYQQGITAYNLSSAAFAQMIGGAVNVGSGTGPEVQLISSAGITVTTLMGATGSPASNVTSFSTLQNVIELPSNNVNEKSPSIIGQTLITYTGGQTADAVLYLSGTTSTGTLRGTFRLDISQSSGLTYDQAIIEGIYTIVGRSAVTLVPTVFRDITVGSMGAYNPAAVEGSSGVPVNALAARTDGALLPSAFETWHAATAGNGWAGTIYYKLTSDNEVYFWSNNLTAPAASVNGVTIISILTSVYIPNVSMTFAVQQSVSGFGSRMTWSNTGTLQSTGVSASAGVSLGYRVPLDLP